MEDININNDTIQTTQLEKMLFRKESDDEEYLIPIKNITRITGGSKSSTICSSDGLSVKINVSLRVLMMTLYFADDRADHYRFIVVYSQSELSHFDKIQSEEVNRLKSIRDDFNLRMSHIDLEATNLYSFSPSTCEITRYDYHWRKEEDEALRRAKSWLESTIYTVERIDILERINNFARLQSAIEQYKHIDTDFVIEEMLEDAHYRLQERLVRQLDKESSDEP